MNYSISESEEINLEDIEFLVDGKEQPLFYWAHVWNFLGISHADTSFAKLSQ